MDHCFDSLLNGWNVHRKVGVIAVQSEHEHEDPRDDAKGQAHLDDFFATHVVPSNQVPSQKRAAASTGDG